MPNGSYGSLVFQKADIAKDAITKEAKLKISRLYTEWANDIGKKAEFYKNKTTKSSWLQEMNMRQLQGQLQEQSLQIANEVKGIVEDSIYKVADSVVQANSNWLKDLGFPANGVDSAFVSIPDQTVRRLVTGQIYDTGWSLSKSIWGDNEKTLSKLYEIVAQGLAQNMSVYDVSKILEAYVNPNRAKQWNLMMPDGKRIYKRSVDYNAQRLARTLAQHGYQTSFIAVTEKNPFVTDYIWRANGSRVCELCMQRDGMHFKKDELPLDHPNGMCTMEPNVDDDKMIDQLADWINSPDGTYPEIDEFAKQFGYVPLVKESVKENQSTNAIPVNAHHIAQGKDISKAWERRPDKFDFEIEDVINAQGFDGLPRVVSRAEFDKAVKAANGGKGFIAQRTYSAPDQETLDAYRDQLYHGKWYVDCSTGGAQYGQGMYCAADYAGKLSEGIKEEMAHYKSLYIMDLRDDSIPLSERLSAAKNTLSNAGYKDEYSQKWAEAYLAKDKKAAKELMPKISEDKRDEINMLLRTSVEKPSYTETITLDPSARIISHNDAKKMMANAEDKWRESIRKQEQLIEDEYHNILKRHQEMWKNGEITADEGMSLDEKAAKEKYEKIKELGEKPEILTGDLGAFIASKGYDAINAEEHGASSSYTVILNRTKVIIKGE